MSRLFLDVLCPFALSDGRREPKTRKETNVCLFGVPTSSEQGGYSDVPHLSLNSRWGGSSAKGAGQLMLGLGGNSWPPAPRLR